MFVDFFLYPKPEKGGGHWGVAIYIWIIYLYIKHKLPGKSVAFNSTAGQGSQAHAAAPSLSAEWQLSHPPVRPVDWPSLQSQVPVTLWISEENANLTPVPKMQTCSPLAWIQICSATC